MSHDEAIQDADQVIILSQELGLDDLANSISSLKQDLEEDKQEELQDKVIGIDEKLLYRMRK